MLKAKQTVKLSNLINDCIIMVQQAGALVQQIHLQSAYTSAGQGRRQKIASTDLLIRQTYLHNLSQLFPGIQVVCEGERPTRDAHFAESAFI